MIKKKKRKEKRRKQDKWSLLASTRLEEPYERAGGE
jgi:hypothetical protein